MSPRASDTAFDFEGSGRHQLTLIARHSRAALAALDHGLDAAGARLTRLRLREICGAVEADVEVGDISASSARRLADRLAERPGVERVRVEHCWTLNLGR